MGMDYWTLIMETEIINGHKAVVRHFFKPKEIKPNSRWIGVSGGIVTVEQVKCYPASDHEDEHWYEVYYSWEENGEKRTHHKESFAFQCRYFLILE